MYTHCNIQAKSSMSALPHLSWIGVHTCSLYGDTYSRDSRDFARKAFLTGTDERDYLEVLCILYDLRATLPKH